MWRETAGRGDGSEKPVTWGQNSERNRWKPLQMWLSETDTSRIDQLYHLKSDREAPSIMGRSPTLHLQLHNQVPAGVGPNYELYQMEVTAP